MRFNNTNCFIFFQKEKMIMINHNQNIYGRINDLKNCCFLVNKSIESRFNKTTVKSRKKDQGVLAFKTMVSLFGKKLCFHLKNHGLRQMEYGEWSMVYGKVKKFDHVYCFYVL